MVLTAKELKIERRLDQEQLEIDLEILGEVQLTLDAIDMAWDDEAPILFFLISKVRLMSAMASLNQVNLDLYYDEPEILKFNLAVLKADVWDAFEDCNDKLNAHSSLIKS